MKRLLTRSTVRAFLTLGLILLALPWQLAVANREESLDPPATYYGQILPTANYTPLPGQTITAWIGTTVCGEDITQLYGGEVVYAIDVLAEGIGGQPNCGAPGRNITFYIGDQVMIPVVAWPGSGVFELDLSANQLPISNEDAYFATEDTLYAVGAPGVLANDVDPDGMPLTAIQLSDVGRGSLVFHADGAFEYTPLFNDNGVVTFTYQVSDSLELSAPATVTITIQAINDPPIANSDIYTTTGSSPLIISAPGILENDTDVDSGVLTVILVSSTLSGTLQLEVDGAFTYIPFPGFTGTDIFSYHAYDGSLTSNLITVEIRVQARQVYLPLILKH